MLKIYCLSSIVISCFIISSCTDNGGYKESPNGLQYKIIVDNKKPKAQPGQYISYHVFWRTLKDSLLFSSENVNQPLVSLVARPISKGDLWEIFTYLGPGDSASCKVPARNIFKSYLPSNMKADDMMKVDFKVLDVLSQKDIDSLQAKRASQNLNNEDKQLQDFMRKNNLDGTKTPSGMYVVIEKQGSGKQPVNGNTISVNYTGKLLNGMMFDTSLKPGGQPYEFVIGSHSVISGWDEGLLYFKAGGSGKLLIPSRLGYGEQGNGPKIGPNQPLIFDVQLVAIK